MPGFGVELGVYVLQRVVVPVVRELWSPVESLSAVLKALGVRRASSSPLGIRVIVTVVRSIYLQILPRTKRRTCIPGAPAELWRREVWGFPGFLVLRRRLKTLRRGEGRRVCVPQQRRGGGEEILGPLRGGRSSGKTGRQRRGGRLREMRSLAAVAFFSLVRHCESSKTTYTLNYLLLCDRHLSKFQLHKFLLSRTATMSQASTFTQACAH